MDTLVDRRFQRAWAFFQANAAQLVLAGLVVVLGWALVLPGPWFTLNLLAEITDSLRAGRPVDWQASFKRPDLLVRSWGLFLTMSLGIAVGFAACMAPGTALTVAWMQAPARVADGQPVLAALGASFRTVSRGWTGAVLNALILLAMVGVSMLTGVVILLTLPLGLTYLSLCYLDETDAAMVPVSSLETVSV
jgi:hypothetical protein